MDIEQILAKRDRITIAILALGGQGGGVLADWIVEIGNRNGFIAQGTSVPGVAQRTGTTIYYIEMVRQGAEGGNLPQPVLALTPAPGDIDVVIASELMEGGRAILRGFVTEDRTTLISSTHRVFAVTEKSVPGDGTAAGQRILDAAARRSKRFIGFDMEEVADQAGSVISSVMLGALAGSGVLPFGREVFEEAIRHGGKAVPANLKGFGAGFDRSRVERAAIEKAEQPPEPTTAAGRAVRDRIANGFALPVQAIALVAAQRLFDYQDADYARFYCDRLEAVARLDDGGGDWRLTCEAARYLGLWMTYEDTIRVADLKIRATRSERIRKEVRVGDGQVLAVTEYMHPRLREVCETLPRALGAAILASPRLVRLLDPMFTAGRHVRTTSLRWYLAQRMIAGLRGIRRSTLRYAEEQARIDRWLAALADMARQGGVGFAAEIATLPRLIKGYSDTFERGLARFDAIMEQAPALARRADGAARIAALRDAALADESSEHFAAALRTANAA